ncbi:hypothetical protein M3Y97_00108500 [Aphelenchoides bicaudatus]|nr:hypothetical protein M3Y97_00108500 [Aphelenchoides bicaudatus]
MYKQSIATLFLIFTVTTSVVLKCHEDSLDQNDKKYYLNDCSEATKFCAVLSNTKTNEVFHACATERMCQKPGNFDYQQHEELHIRCCDSHGCNNAFIATISFGVLALTTLISLL